MQLAMLDARAADVGLRIGWEMHVTVDPRTGCIGLTAGAQHVFLYGPARLDSVAVREIETILSALRRRERTVVEDHQGNPRLA